MLWSILIPALNSRPWKLLHQKICKQIIDSGLTETVECLVEADDGFLSSGTKRNTLTAAAKGEYISFIDDDDDVSDLYVQKIADMLTRLQGTCDVLSFKLHMSGTVERRGRVVPLNETWDFIVGPDNRSAGLMTVNHLCVWRTAIAKLVAWCPDLGYGDDQLWYQTLWDYFAWKKQALKVTHMNTVLYHYRFSHAGTSNQTNHRISFARGYFGDGLSAVMNSHLGICVEAGRHRAQRDRILVRANDGREYWYKDAELYAPGGQFAAPGSTTQHFARIYLK